MSIISTVSSWIGKIIPFRKAPDCQFQKEHVPCDDLRQYLYRLDDLGWPIFPLWHINPDGTCGCGRSKSRRRPCNEGQLGRHPKIKWSQLVNPVGRDFIDTWLNKGSNHLGGWAVNMGPAKICAIDLDLHKPGAAEAWAPIYAQFKDELDAALRFDSARGDGSGHRVFLIPSWLPATTNLSLGTGIEFLCSTRNESGVLVAHNLTLPLSPHRVNGHRSTIGNNVMPQEMSDGLLQFIFDKEQERQAKREQFRGGTGATVPDGYTGAAAYRTHSEDDHRKIIDRARAYVDKIPAAISGQGGSKQTFAVACSLVLGFDLHPADAYPIMVEYSNRCKPEWSEKEIWDKLESAEKKGGQRGYILNRSNRTSLYDIEDLPEWARNIKIDFKESLRQLERDKAAQARANVAKIDLSDLFDPGPHLGGDGAALTPTFPAYMDDPDLPPWEREEDPDPAKRKTIRSLEKYSVPPCHCKVLARNKFSKKMKAFFLACWRWSCPYCAEHLKADWTQHATNTISNHAAAIADGDDQARAEAQIFYIGHVNVSDWKATHQRISRQKADYITICADAATRDVVCTSSFNATCRAVTAAEAAAFASAAIKVLPLCKKPISTSRNWKLPPDEKLKEWQRIGKLPPELTATKTREIIEAHECTDIIEKTYPTRKKCKSIEWKFPEDWQQEHLDNLYEDLCGCEILRDNLNRNRVIVCVESAQSLLDM